MWRVNLHCSYEISYSCVYLVNFYHNAKCAVCLGCLHNVNCINSTFPQKYLWKFFYKYIRSTNSTFRNAECFINRESFRILQICRHCKQWVLQSTFLNLYISTLHFGKLSIRFFHTFPVNLKNTMDIMCTNIKKAQVSDFIKDSQLNAIAKSEVFLGGMVKWSDYLYQNVALNQAIVFYRYYSIKECSTS